MTARRTTPRPEPEALAAGSVDEARFGATGARHGTVTGHSRHLTRCEEPCEACRAAKAEYDERWRGTTRRARLGRLNARAQARAYGELARRHKAEYDELYAAHRAELLAESGEPAPVAGNPAVASAVAAGGRMLAPGRWRFTDEAGADDAWEVARHGRNWRAWALPRRPRQPAAVTARTFTTVRRWLATDAAATALRLHRAALGAPDGGRPATETAHGGYPQSAEEM